MQRVWGLREASPSPASTRRLLPACLPRVAYQRAADSLKAGPTHVVRALSEPGGPRPSAFFTPDSVFQFPFVGPRGCWAPLVLGPFWGRRRQRYLWGQAGQHIPVPLPRHRHRGRGRRPPAGLTFQPQREPPGSPRSPHTVPPLPGTLRARGPAPWGAAWPLRSPVSSVPAVRGEATARCPQLACPCQPRTEPPSSVTRTRLRVHVTAVKASWGPWLPMPLPPS